MDASQYKDYVLVLLFIKYVSDKYAGQKFAPIAIPVGSSFADMAALKGKPDIGDQINKRIVEPLAKANKLADMPDFNDDGKLGSGKEKVERLTNLIAIFENPALDFSKPRDGADPRHPAQQDHGRDDGLRSDLRFGLAAAQGRRRGGHQGHAVRTGEGLGDERARTVVASWRCWTECCRGGKAREACSIGCRRGTRTGATDGGFGAVAGTAGRGTRQPKRHAPNCAVTRVTA